MVLIPTMKIDRAKILIADLAISFLLVSVYSSSCLLVYLAVEASDPFEVLSSSRSLRDSGKA